MPPAPALDRLDLVVVAFAAGDAADGWRPADGDGVAVGAPGRPVVGVALPDPVRVALANRRGDDVGWLDGLLPLAVDLCSAIRDDLDEFDIFSAATAELLARWRQLWRAGLWRWPTATVTTTSSAAELLVDALPLRSGPYDWAVDDR